MIPGLPEGDLHLPTLDEPAHDLQRVAPWIGAQQQRLRVEPALRVAQQHPADRHDRQPGVAPDGGGGADLDGPLALAVPAGPGTTTLTQRVSSSTRTAASFGRRAPLVRGRPTVPGWRGGAGSYKAASNRRRVMQTSPWRARAARRSRAAKLLSPSSTTSRPGSHRRACKPICRAQSVSFLCRLPRARQQRSEGARAVRNGKAQTRPAQGIGARSIRLSQRRPLAFAFTKWPFEERTGSR
jgi:hypothetical protein